ncbi:DUF5615 family PIN-like protein [Candidatus Palauibacter sp.]|uniref:DUF5615 family PIN-like protein n=1 Tax=Candidatus Palauibacter sp. TaxID=3101350 RepID=UPI003C6F6754
MRFKLDENLPRDLAVLFRDSGHDAVTVLDQGLGGATDSHLASICVSEHRAVVTLDKDFLDIRAYPPSRFAGLVVFRLQNHARDHVLRIGRRFLGAVRDTDLRGQLWIVEETRIRVRD